LVDSVIIRLTVIVLTDLRKLIVDVVWLIDWTAVGLSVAVCRVSIGVVIMLKFKIAEETDGSGRINELSESVRFESAWPSTLQMSSPHEVMAACTVCFCSAAIGTGAIKPWRVFRSVPHTFFEGRGVAHTSLATTIISNFSHDLEQQGIASWESVLVESTWQ
jgi:hypothetical protein